MKEATAYAFDELGLDLLTGEVLEHNTVVRQMNRRFRFVEGEPEPVADGREITVIPIRLRKEDRRKPKGKMSTIHDRLGVSGRAGAPAVRHRGDVGQPQRRPRAGQGHRPGDGRVRRAGAEAADLHRRHDDARRRPARLPAAGRARAVERTRGCTTSTQEAHTPVGVARADLRAGQRRSAWSRSRPPFDPTAIDFLEKLNVPAYKVASNEIGDLPLVRGMAETGKPIIISTGSATLTDIDAAVRAARATGNEQIIVLSCTASYPAPPEQSNLRAHPGPARCARRTGRPVRPHDGHRRRRSPRSPSARP